MSKKQAKNQPGLTSGPVTSPAPITPRLLNIKQAAAYCGAAVWAMRQAIAAKELAACIIGRRFLIPREEIDAFINRKLQERAA